MKKIIFPLLTILTLFSCSTESQQMEGIFENPMDGSRTIIKKNSEDEYQVTAAFNPELSFSTKRNVNILTGTFEGKSIVIEYQNSYNTIVSKSGDEIIFSAERVNNP